VPQAILQESFLSFLGVGIQPPQATWGSLAADGVHLLNPIQFDWWLVVVPCVALSVTLLALNFVGDGIRDALDVKQSRGVSPR
jgi:peptide/nickel transport system permease protein/oligopeptide transport system permease protein